MEFKKFSAGLYSYGTMGDDAIDTPGRARVANVNFTDPNFWEQINDPNHENYKNLEKFLVLLALCHTIILDERTGKYNASSPDELALVNAAKFMGFEFKKKDENNNLII